MCGERHTEGRRHLQRAGRLDREGQVENCEGAGKGPRDGDVKRIIIIIIILVYRIKDRQNP